MKKKILVLLTMALLLLGAFLIKNQLSPDTPKFDIQLQERIFFELMEDSNTDHLEKNIIDFDSSNVPEDATYSFDVKNNIMDFNYIERATAMGWDEEGREIVPGYTSPGTLTAFYYTIPGNTPLFDALIQGDENRGVEPLKPHSGTLTITSKGDSEDYTFEYYVIEVFSPYTE